MHSRRLITAFASLPILLLGVFWQHGDWVTTIAVALCFAGAREELVSLLDGSKNRMLSVWQNATALVLFFSVLSEHFSIALIATVLFFWGSCLISMSGGIHKSRNDYSGHGLLTIYLLLPLACVIYLRGLEYGREYLFFLLVVSCVTDSGAYYGGKLLGRHKLAPKISPKKTWEGAICGSGLALFVMALATFYQSAFLDRSLWFPIPHHYLPVLTVTLAMSIAGQLGDLCESAMKRDADVKDSGSSLTGHGGFLDMMDAMLWIAPAMTGYVIGIL